MKVGVVECNYITQGSLRLDGNFYMNDNSRLSMVLDRNVSKCSYLSELAVVMNPPVFKRQFCQNTPNAVQYFQSSDVQNSSERSEVFVNKAQAERIKAIVRTNDILVTGFGTIGNIRLVSSLQDGVCYANNVARIKANEGVPYGYLYAFMSTKYACAQLNKNASGSVVRYIESPGIKRTLIPIFSADFQTKIDKQIKEAAALRVEANKLLEEAKKKVEEFVNYEPESKKAAVVSSQRILQSFGHRFEANFHISAGSTLEDYIKEKFDYKLLGDVCKSISRPDIFKRNYVKDGVMFLGGADIMLATPDSGKYLSRKTPNIEALLVEEDWILIPRSGTIGDVVYTHSEHAQKLVSEHVIRACPNNILSSGYIYAFLSSKVGKALIQRYIFGSVIQHIESPHLSRIPIPLMTEKEMAAIDSSIKKYKDNIGKAIRLERSAIEAVEQEIDSWSK